MLKDSLRKTSMIPRTGPPVRKPPRYSGEMIALTKIYGIIFDAGGQSFLLPRAFIVIEDHVCLQQEVWNLVSRHP